MYNNRHRLRTLSTKQHMKHTMEGIFEKLIFTLCICLVELSMMGG